MQVGIVLKHSVDGHILEAKCRCAYSLGTVQIRDVEAVDFSAASTASASIL